MDTEKREAPRVDILGKLSGEVSVLAPIVIHDISRTGAQVECAFPLILGSGHELRLFLGDDPVVVKARVVHCQITDLGHELVRYVAGVEFVDLAPHAAQAISAYIERLERERLSPPGGPRPPAKP
jgi:c-di-GMP-binding flagellar brake protein YcgR